jgi:hypothetical protein
MISLRDFVKLLHAWIERTAQNHQYPEPGWHVDVSALLDFVYKTSGLPKPEPR